MQPGLKHSALKQEHKHLGVKSDSSSVGTFHVCYKIAKKVFKDACCLGFLLFA
jgi:hypothetical protein